MKAYTCALLMCVSLAACGRDIDQYTEVEQGTKKPSKPSGSNDDSASADDDDDTTDDDDDGTGTGGNGTGGSGGTGSGGGSGSGTGSGGTGTSGGSGSGSTTIPRLRGVNLAAGEFGSLPGVYDKDYTYPNNGEVDYYFGKGMNVFRFPFLWERVQSTLNGAVDLAKLDGVINYATKTKGGCVLLDMHNYARYRGVVIGTGNVATSAFEDVWKKIAAHYKDNSHVIFGIMNEPYGMDINLWLTDANAAIKGIRDSGATNLITVPGIAWTGAHSWISSGNADVMEGVNDPGDNFIFEMHQYFDNDSSGTTDKCVSATIGAERLTAATKWLKDNGFRALLGEFGATQSSACLTTLDNTLKYMESNKDQWMGWTYWAGGPWWGNYMFSSEPSGGVDKPQMTKMIGNLK